MLRIQGLTAMEEGWVENISFLGTGKLFKISKIIYSCWIYENREEFLSYALIFKERWINFAMTK